MKISGVFKHYITTEEEQIFLIVMWVYFAVSIAGIQKGCSEVEGRWWKEHRPSSCWWVSLSRNPLIKTLTHVIDFNGSSVPSFPRWLDASQMPSATPPPATPEYQGIGEEDALGCVVWWWGGRSWGWWGGTDERLPLKWKVTRID